MTSLDDLARPHKALVCPLMVVHGGTFGPRLVVTGPRKLLESLGEQLWDLLAPTDIRGSLILRDTGQSPVYDKADHVLILSCTPQHAVRLVFDHMALLGMIAHCPVAMETVA